MAEIRNLTRNGETFYPLTCTEGLVNRDGNVVGEINDIFDVSEYNASGTPPILAKYDNLSLALAAVPTSKQKGGMTIRYVQTSDNKYVHYNLIANEFTTDVQYWQNINDIYDKPMVQSLSNTIDMTGVSYTDGYAINRSGQKTSSATGKLSNDISLKEGQSIEVKVESSATYAALAIHNSDESYTVIQTGEIGNEKVYQFTAYKDCNIVVTGYIKKAVYILIRNNDSILLNETSISTATNITIPSNKYVLVEVSGGCTIITAQTNPQTILYQNVQSGLYPVCLDNDDLRILRFTDVVGTTSLKIYGVSEAIYAEVLNKNEDKKNQMLLYKQYSISANTTLPIIYPSQNYMILEVSGDCSINVINGSGVQSSLYSNVPIGRYFVDATKIDGGVKQFRITDMTGTLVVKVFDVTQNYYNTQQNLIKELPLFKKSISSDSDMSIVTKAKRLLVTIGSSASISYYPNISGAASVVVYRSVPQGTYPLECEDGIDRIRITDMNSSVEVKAVAVSDAEYVEFITKNGDGSKIRMTTTVSSATNIDTPKPYKYIRIDTTGIVSISVIRSMSPYVQESVYVKVPAGSYGVSMQEKYGETTQRIRFTDMTDSVGVTISEIDYYEYKSLKNAYDVSLKGNITDFSALGLYPIIQPDQRAESIVARMCNSRMIGKDLATPLYNFYREGYKGISVLKTAKIDDVLYVVLLNHTNDGPVTESITGKLFMKLYKLSFPDMTLIAENVFLDYNDTLHFSDGTDYTFSGGDDDMCFYSPQLINVDGELHITFAAYINNVWTELHGVFDTDNLVLDSLEKCLLIDGENEVVFDNTHLASIMNSPFTQQIELATSGYTKDNNGNYYGGCAQTQNTRSYIVKTTDFSTYEIVFTTDDKICKAQSEATPLFCTYNNADYLLYAVRTRYASQSYVFLLKIALSDYSVKEVALVTDCHTEPYLFAYNNNVYLLSGANGKGESADRYYYRFTKINLQSIGASEIVADINGDVNVANGGIVVDGLDIYKTTDIYTIAKCQLNYFSKQDLNFIIDRIIGLE